MKTLIKLSNLDEYIDNKNSQWIYIHVRIENRDL